MLEHLAASRGKRRPSHQGERYVRADLRPESAKFCIGLSERIELVHAAQRSRRVCTPAGKSRCNGNPLVNADMNAAAHAALPHKKRRCAIGKISLVCLESRQVNRQRDPRLLLGERQRIGECEGLHHRRDFVVAVLTLPENVEQQVDLRIPIYRHHRQTFFHCAEDLHHITSLTPSSLRLAGF